MRSYDTVICDVDGVLIDVSRSFSAAAVDAVYAATNSRQFTSAEVQMLKASRGFNNDWHVAIAGGAWVSFTLSTPFDEFVSAIEEAGGGLAGLSSLSEVQLSADFIALLTRLAQEARQIADGVS